MFRQIITLAPILIAITLSILAVFETLSSLSSKILYTFFSLLEHNRHHLLLSVEFHRRQFYLALLCSKPCPQKFFVRD